MSTNSDSKYVRARKAYRCNHCGAEIARGERHLAYKPGLYRIERICLASSTKRSVRDDHLLYDCTAVLDEIIIARATFS